MPSNPSIPWLPLQGLRVERGRSVPTGIALSVVVMAVDGDPRVVNAVSSLIGQSNEIEIVVVNSGEGSVKAYLEAHLDRILLLESADRLLPGATRNLGISRCSGGIIAFLAADCMAGNDWVALRIAAHARGAQAVASALRPAAGPNGVPTISWACHALVHMRRAPECPPAKATRYGVSYRRQLFERHGLFRPDMRIAEDTDFNQRIGEAVIEWVPEIITFHRYPTSLFGAVGDLFHRGGRMWRWRRGVGRSPLTASLRQIADSWKDARSLSKLTEGEVRQSLRRAGGYLALLAVAEAAGAVAARMAALRER